MKYSMRPAQGTWYVYEEGLLFPLHGYAVANLSYLRNKAVT